MTEIARQPQGTPVGGQFAATSHKEADIALTEPKIYTAEYSGKLELKTAYYDNLPQWPEAVPVPQVSYDFDNGKVNTYLSIDGYEPMKFWTDDADGTMNSTDIGESHWADFHDEDADAAMAWGKAVHERIDSSMYGIMLEAGYNGEVSDAVIAHATGADPSARTVPNLGDVSARQNYAESVAGQLADLKQKLQNTYMVGAAQEVKDANPNIASFTLKVDRYLEIDGAWDADGDPLEESELDGLGAIFRYKDEDDFNTFLGFEKVIDVDEAIAWRP